ncbi:hypothetical protein HK102_000096 [Quaeritorhiza haematococci]|nr:hypothetical protein HK102_000096 [Quaeritorhiza haematococci]
MVQAASKSAYVYPTIRRDESVQDDHHGTIVKDPYRWLEDPHSEETKSFVDAQNGVFQSFIKEYPHKEAFRQRLTEMFDYERYGCPFKRGDNYYYFHNSGLQPQSVLYKQKTLTDKPQVFLDPNTLSEDGTVSLNTYGFSKSGKYFAHGLSASGSDWVTIHVKETRDGAPEHVEAKPLQWAKFTGISWTHDDKGFFYTRYPKPEKLDTDKAGTETDSTKNAMLCYHKIGTSQDEDLICYKDPENPDHIFGAEVTDDGKYVILTISESCDPANKLYIAEINATDVNGEGLKDAPKFTKIVDKFEAEYSYITNEGTLFYFQSTLNAPKRRVVKYDLKEPEKGFVEVVPERQEVLQWNVVVNKDKLVLVYLQDVKHVIHLCSLATGKPVGEQKELPLPLGSIVNSMTGRKEDDEMFYQFASFLTPGMIYRFDFKTMTHSTFRETKVQGFQSEKFETKQVFYPSKDGTKIPMYIISKKGVELNGNNVTLLYGYGGFNINITPAFSVTWLTFIEHMNGVVAVANIRGGGEYGEELWYKQGKLDKKQNVFDDFQHAAKYLIEQKWTSPRRLAINGASNGGLLVGACVNQAPELFGCAIADVGVMDMLRFHKFTIGHAWVSDYGNPDKKEDFDVVIKYSPIHNVDEKKVYPAVLLTTSDHDDRVVPLHSYKLIATMQHKLKDNPNPLMIRIETKAGHGAGKSTKQRIEEATDKYSYLARVLGAEWVAKL